MFEGRLNMPMMIDISHFPEDEKEIKFPLDNFPDLGSFDFPSKGIQGSISTIQILMFNL